MSEADGELEEVPTVENLKMAGTGSENEGEVEGDD